MKYLPFDSLLDMTVVVGCQMLLWNAIMMLFIDPPVWQLCLSLVLAIPGLFSIAAPVIGCVTNGISWLRMKPCERWRAGDL